MDFSNEPQTVIWFKDRYLADELNLRPPFQRQPVWSARQKHTLVESILLGLPIPEIYVQHTIDRTRGDERSAYAVVDGQQRIRSVLQFIGVDRAETEAEFNKFALDRLPRDSHFFGTTYAELDQADRDRFLSYKFAVRHLRTTDDEAVRDIFRRINKFVTKLNEQELRNATYGGPFIRLAGKLADDDFWVLNGMVKPAQIRRMKDIEFVSELMIGVLHGPQSGSPKVIDEYYSRYEDYDDEFPSQKICERRFSQAMEVARSVLDGSIERFRSNRTDFYTFFLTVSALLQHHTLPRTEIGKLRASLKKFEGQVDARLADESTATPHAVVSYVRAVEKGANEKKRRADRQEALTDAIKGHFKRTRP